MTLVIVVVMNSGLTIFSWDQLLSLQNAGDGETTRRGLVRASGDLYMNVRCGERLCGDKERIATLQVNE